MDIFYLRAEDFNSAQQRQIYNQMRERANTRLKRRRRENNEIYANKEVSQFLKRRNYRYFPKSSSISDKELESYLNELLRYVQDRTSLAKGIQAVKEERLQKLMSTNNKSGRVLIEHGTREELDKMLRSDEFSEMAAMYDYELLMEDFSAEMERGHSVEQLLNDWRNFLDRVTMPDEEKEAMSEGEILYSDLRKMQEERYRKESR